MSTQKYNGWTNYETWNAALWLDNDYGLQRWMVEEAQRCYDGNEGDESSAKSDLAKVIEDQFQQEADENAPKYGWMADAINAYIGEVDFYEIAEHFLADVEKKSED